jgi:CheY-like chemotaxis protein
VKQVLINLLSNAIKYNRVGGTVVVDCSASAPERVRISVRDTGEGLPPEKMAQLFQPFNRLGREAGGEEGTGIGLVVAKQLVELMGGVIGAESTLGTGSVFWIELLADVAPQPVVGEDEPTAVARPQIPAGASPRLLLYVEDNPANLQLVEQLIARRPDLRLLSAVTGRRGVELAHSSRPELILMDINLPDISGLEALAILRAHPATAHTPVVAVSANAMPRDIEDGLAAGFFRYLTKPIKVDAFMAVLDLALAVADEAGGSVPARSPDPPVPADGAGSEGSPTGAVPQEVPAALPAELVGRLREAALQADPDQLLTLAEEVDRYDVPSGRKLRHLVRAFDYQSLLEMLPTGESA